MLTVEALAQKLRNHERRVANDKKRLLEIKLRRLRTEHIKMLNVTDLRLQQHMVRSHFAHFGGPLANRISQHWVLDEITELYNLRGYLGDNLCMELTNAGMSFACSYIKRLTNRSPFYLPLDFWFYRVPGLALPPVAYEYYQKIIPTSPGISSICY